MAYLGQVGLQLLLGVSRLGDASGQGNIGLLLLPSHVVAGRLQHSVQDRPQSGRVLTLLVRLRDVPVGKVFPLVRRRGTGTKARQTDKKIRSGSLYRKPQM